jgi:molybdopterin molybdotransferase
MAQLTDDCFAFSGPLLPLDEMERLIAARIAAVPETERVPLRGARMRVTAAADVIAPVDLPPFDNSAVDGYAVRHADLKRDADTRLLIAGRLTAGAQETLILKSGEAIRIFTGAAMPVGADTVFMQEDVTVDGDHVIVPRGLKRGSNRRLAGEDVPKGHVALPAGTVLEPQHIALAAALGLTDIEVRRRLNVAIFSTGDEVVEPGAPLGRAAIYDANRYLLSALLDRLGAQVTDLGILADNPQELARALADAAAGHDLIVTSGGVSTGEADYVRSAVERIGNLVFWRVAIKPGRPVALGVIHGASGHSAAFIGLPGNPVAVFVTFVCVVKVLLRQLSGARPQKLATIATTEA